MNYAMKTFNCHFSVHLKHIFLFTSSYSTDELIWTQYILICYKLIFVDILATPFYWSFNDFICPLLFTYTSSGESVDKQSAAILDF